MTSQCLCHKITVLTETLKNDLDGLNTCTKLTFTDIHKLTELCLSKSYFIYKNKMRLLENAGPIGLSLMVVLSESYLQHVEHKEWSKPLLNKYNRKHFNDMWTTVMLALHQNTTQTFFKKF